MSLTNRDILKPSAALNLISAALLGISIIGCSPSKPEAAIVEPVEPVEPAKNVSEVSEKVETNKLASEATEKMPTVNAAKKGEATPIISATEAGEDEFYIEDNSRMLSAAEAGEDEFYIEDISRAGEAGQYASTQPTQAELTTADGTVLEEIVPGMIVDMPYEVARILIVNEGWQPMDGLTPASRNGMDYKEIEDCSGSGLGPCHMIFVDAEMNKLSVGVITSGVEPTVRHWSFY